MIVAIVEAMLVGGAVDVLRRDPDDVPMRTFGAACHVLAWWTTPLAWRPRRSA